MSVVCHTSQRGHDESFLFSTPSTISQEEPSQTLMIYVRRLRGGRDLELRTREFRGRCITEAPALAW